MKNNKTLISGRELFKYVPGTVRVINIVASSYRDEEGIEIAKGILRKFARHNKARTNTTPDNHVMITEGAPFSEQLSYLSDKLELRTFTYLPSKENQVELSEQGRSMQEQVIRHLVGENGMIVAFPKSACPKMIRPMKEIETLKYRTWGAVAMGIKLGVPVYIYVPSIHDELTFCGPLNSRGKVLASGEWGAWILVEATPEDVDAELREVMSKLTGSKQEVWHDGVACRPNFFSQN